jgi:hypothetical protein
VRFNIEWTLFMEVTTIQKCEKLLSHVAHLLGSQFASIKIEPYWKEQGTFKVIAQSAFDAPTTRDGLYEIMMLLNRLAGTWVVKGPTLDDSWTFSGMAQPNTPIRVQGVKSVAFHSSARVTQTPAMVHPVTAAMNVPEGGTANENQLNSPTL